MEVAQESISFEEQQGVSIRTLTIQSSNMRENFDSSLYPENVQIIVECLKNSALARAFTYHKEIPQSLVNLAFSTAKYLKETDRVSFEVLGEKILHITKFNFVKLFGFSTDGVFVNPTTEQLIEMFNQMGYTPYMTKISQFKKNTLSLIWNFFFTMFKRCLCGRKSGHDAASQLFLTALFGVYFDVKVDYGSILWYEFVASLKITNKDMELSSHRYWSVIVKSAYTNSKTPIKTNEESMIKIQSFLVPTKFADQAGFSFVGQVSETILKRIPMDSSILIKYRASLPIPYLVRDIPIEISNEIQTQFVNISKKRKEVVESVEM